MAALNIAFYLCIEDIMPSIATPVIVTGGGTIHKLVLLRKIKEVIKTCLN